MAPINRPTARGSKTAVIIGILTGVSILALFSIDKSPRGANAYEVQNRKLPHALISRSQRELRELYLASRLGLKYGIPKHARQSAMAKTNAMTQASAGDRGGAANANLGFGASMPAVTSTWNLIGPHPMSETANFTGTPIGNKVAMTGRISAVAADAHGLIVAGAASRGLWVSIDNGGIFTSVFDGQPTQAVGAVALDTTTTPSTIYVGTGEGNGSVDSLYGAGMFKSSNLGQTWTSLGPMGNFDHAAFTAIALDTSTPGTPRIFAGTTSGFSGSRADAGFFETDSTKAGLWFSADGGNNWSHYAETKFDTCDLVGDGTAPCPADDVRIDPTNPMNVYVAIDSDAIYFSHDGGATFTRASFPGVPVLQGRQSLAVGPVVRPPKGPATPAGGIVYAMIGARLGDLYESMFTSFDAGVTWNPKVDPTVPSFTANNVTIDGTNPGNFSQSPLLAGVLGSECPNVLAVLKHSQKK